MKKLLLLLFISLIEAVYSQNSSVFINADEKFPYYYKEVKMWYDGTLMNDIKVDGYIYVKTNNKYYVVQDYYMGVPINAKLFGVKADGITDDSF